jgi:molybdopterin synthase catalytic subunit
MKPTDIGTQQSVFVAVTDEPLDVMAIVDFVADDASGSTVLFSGTVRNHSPGRQGVTRLEYEAYEGVVVTKIREVVDEAKEQWPIERVAAVHRTGVLGLGESAVIVAVSTAHRSDGFPACRYIIDELKHRVPIWKKEHWDGGSEWVREDLHHAGEPSPEH